MALCRGTGSGRLLLLLLWAALRSQLCPASAAAQGDAEALAGLQNWTADEFAELYNSSRFYIQVLEQHYLELAELCWSNFTHWMMNVSRAQLCEWRVISRPYSYLQHCLESFADHLKYGYPNSIAEVHIFKSHHLYFLNCTQEHPVFVDPPEDMLLALIMAPICLIPFLVTLVVWRSKDGKTQS